MTGLDELLNEFAERVAAVVIDRLRSGAPNMIDQTGSPLGARRHCSAVKRRVARGEPGAVVIGRRHMLSPEALAEELKRFGTKASCLTPEVSSVRAELERELRLLPQITASRGERQGTVNFEDESYVRLYSRDTPTWLRLGFEGQTVLMHLLRKVDRAGVLASIEDPDTDVHLITGVPQDIVTAGLDKLVKYGVIELVGSSLVMPAFLRAQTTPRTDRARQHDSRDRRLAEARLVTIRDQMSRPVTVGHSLLCFADHEIHSSSSKPNVDTHTPFDASEGQSVERDERLSSAANGNADCHAYVTRGEAEGASKPSPVVSEDRALRGAPGDTKRATELEDVKTVFGAWRGLHGHPSAKLDARRTARIRAGLKNFSAEQLCQALRGALKDDWLMGRDPKSPRKYDGLETLLRDAAQIERLIELDAGGGKRPNGGLSFEQVMG